MSQPLIGASTPARRLALALVICGALGSFGALWWTCSRNPEVYFLPRLAPAQWITWAAVPRATLNARVELATVFRRSFTLDQAPRAATLSVAGLRRYALAVNGRPAPTPEQSARTWKQPDRFDVHGELQAGTNEVAVTVWNSNGPPALWASLDLGGRRLDSDETWQVSCAGAAWRQARLAGKPKPALAGSAAYGGEEPWASLRTRWATLGLFAALSAAAYWLFNRLAGPALVGSASASSVAARLLRSDFLPVFVLGLVWVALFVNNLGMLPNLVGYDVDSHQAYVQFIQQHHALPRADQGWEMFQPPLYYALSAGLLDVLSLSARQDGGVMALRVLGMVIGIAHLMLVWACLRLVFPGERAAQRSGLVLAAAMPPLLYVSQYVSNEGLAAALVSACVFLTLRMIKQERLSWTSCAGLGLCLGAALLAKATALVAVPAVLAALLWKAWVGTAKAAGPGARLVLQLGAIVLICAAVCGWHYGRLWAQYGSPLIGVWDPRLGFSWWQDNGYRTSGFYLRFGSVLAHPWFSSFSSFADGIYGTLWGDGLLGGGADAVARPPWNYDLMAVGYWLALVPTLALLVGGMVAVAKFVRRPSAEWLLLLGLGSLTGLAMIRLSIVLPYQCHVKAFYGLCALVPLCAVGGCGFSALWQWSGTLRPALGVLAGAWAINSFAAFWIAPTATGTLRSEAQSLWKENRRGEAMAVLARIERQPEPNAEAEACLAFLTMETGELAGATRLAEAAVRRGPMEPKGHQVLSALLEQQHQIAEAVAHARRALDLAPGNDRAYEELASLLGTEGRAGEAVEVARDGLAISPLSPDLRYALAAALLTQGEAAESATQLQLACAIKPEWAQPRVLLGAALTSQGKLSEATEELREAIRLAPANADAHSQLAAVLAAQGRTAEAVSEYSEALRLQPGLASALNNLAWIRAASAQSEFRNGPEAVRLAERACQLTGSREAMMVGTLGAAYAEAGRFDEALASAGKARDLALAAGQQQLADKNQKLLELFKARRPYREPEQPAQ